MSSNGNLIHVIHCLCISYFGTIGINLASYQLSVALLFYFIFLCVRMCIIDIAGEVNELTIGWNYNRNMYVYLRGSATYLSLADGFKMSELVDGWHKYCFTFKSRSLVKVSKIIRFLFFMVLPKTCLHNLLQPIILCNRITQSLL